MAQSYFKEFWIIIAHGLKLYPAAIKNRTTGLVSYRVLAEGSNKKADGQELTDPAVAISQFLDFKSLRFGVEGATPDNRYKRGSDHVSRIDATDRFKKDHPSLRW